MMAILDLQRRLREIGRIRIGEQRVSQKSGKNYPAKLDTFRLTSQDQQVIEAAAQAFGGTCRKWDGAPAGEQWEVITKTSQLEVIVPPTGMAFSQHYELWSAGGCKRRCDGAWDSVNDHACVCDPTNRDCDIHTRLSVIVRDLPGLGVWRLDTQGYYAAVELGGVVEVCQAAAERGQMLPARLRLEQRTVKRPDGKGGVETRNYAVPVLDVDVPMAALTAGRPVSIETGEIAGLPSGQPQFSPVPVAELGQGPQPSVAEQVTAVNTPAKKAPRKNAATPIPATGRRPRPAGAAQVSLPREAVEDGAVPEPAPSETVDRTSGPEVAADLWDRESIGTRIGEMDEEMREELAARRKALGLRSVKDPALTKPEVATYLDTINQVQAEFWMRRQKRANAVMGEVGVKADDARHALVKEATGGETESTGRLSAGQIAAVVDLCTVLKAQDTEGEAS